MTDDRQQPELYVYRRGVGWERTRGPVIVGTYSFGNRHVFRADPRKRTPYTHQAGSTEYYSHFWTGEADLVGVAWAWDSDHRLYITDDNGAHHEMVRG